MLDFLWNFIASVVEWLADLFVLRRVRSAKGKQSRPWQDDAKDLAVLDWWLLPLYATAATGAFLLLYLALDWPIWLSFALPAAVVAWRLVPRYLELFRR